MNRSRPATRRSLRDWLVDTTLFCAAVVFGLVLSVSRLEADALPEPAWLFTLDQVTGVVGCAALWLRRRWPVALALALIAVSTYSELVSGAMLVSLFTVAVHRGLRAASATYAVSLVAAAVYSVLRPEVDLTPPETFIFGLVLNGAAVGWGLVVHHRRRLIDSLRERAERAEAEAQLRAEQAQLLAREEIAREMHDVLGHRLSLLSVHAGALEFRPDAPAADIAKAATVIRENARQALQDLREVIGVLRAPLGELPQPVLDDLPRLIDESRRAGMVVTYTEDRQGAVPATVGRTAYRVVQEGLTNVRKHAPGAKVRVRVAGQPGAGLTVDVCDTGDTRAAPAADTAEAPSVDTARGSGLAGLCERVRLAGGRFEAGPDATAGWRLTAWLPWPS